MNSKLNAVVAALGILGPAVSVYAAYTDTCVPGTSTEGACKNPATNCTWEQVGSTGGYSSGSGTCLQIKGNGSGSLRVCKCQ